jgi:hypothetical protein
MYSHPLLKPTLTALRAVEPTFGARADRIEHFRQTLWDALDGTAGHRFVYDKTEEDYVGTVSASVDDVETTLVEHGYQRNFASAVKRVHRAKPDSLSVSTKREVEGVTADSAWVQDPPQFEHDFPESEGPYQHDVYLIGRNGKTDVYAHFENSVRAPEKHLNKAGGTGIPQQNHYIGPLDDIFEL